MDTALHQRRKPTRSTTVHIAVEYRQCVRSGRTRFAVQSHPLLRYDGTAGGGLSADIDRYIGPRHDVAQSDVEHIRGGERRRQSVHQLPVARPSRRRFSIHSQRDHAIVEQSAGAELFAQFDETLALPPGIVGVLLEDLRLQQKVLVLRLEEQRCAGHLGSYFVSFERFQGRSM